MGDNEHIGQPRIVRTELKIQKVAIFVHASYSQMVDEATTAAGISHGTCHNILSDNLNMSCVTQHSVMP
jgi:lipopolysaccharide biosynthesis protein